MFPFSLVLFLLAKKQVLCCIHSHSLLWFGSPSALERLHSLARLLSASPLCPDERIQFQERKKTRSRCSSAYNPTLRFSKAHSPSSSSSSMFFRCIFSSLLHHCSTHYLQLPVTICQHFYACPHRYLCRFFLSRSRLSSAHIVFYIASALGTFSSLLFFSSIISSVWTRHFCTFYCI